MLADISTGQVLTFSLIFNFLERMSLFYAEATPMLKTLSNATTNFVTEVRAPSVPPTRAL